MPKSVMRRLTIAAFAGAVCALLAGCRSGNPEASRTPPKPPGGGDLADFPPPITARAGGEYTLSTKFAETTAGLRVRYRILDGPPAALRSTRGGPVDSVTDAFTILGDDGTARVIIAQPVAAAGTNRVAVEVIRLSPDDPTGYTVVATGETRVRWQTDGMADEGTSERLPSRAPAAVEAGEAKLLVRLTGPRTAVLGEPLPFNVIVTNVGDGPAEKVRVQARLDDGQDGTAKTTQLDETIPALAAGQSRTLKVPVTARRGGKLTVEALASAGSLVALPEAATVEVQDAGLAVSLYGPGRGYVGQEVTWKLLVRNVGDVPLGKVSARASLPAEVRFVRATHGGRVSGKQVVWEFAGLPGRKDHTVEVTAVCDRLVREGLVTATATATPVVDGGGARPSSPRKPITPDRSAQAAFEVIGIPALQMSIKDANDPVGVGQRTTYTIRVRNAGTLPAKQVLVTADVPSLLTTVRASGPKTSGTISGTKVTFAALDSVAPNTEATFVIEVEGAVPGDARFRAEARGVPSSQPLRAEEPTRVLGKEGRPTKP